MYAVVYGMSCTFKIFFYIFCENSLNNTLGYFPNIFILFVVSSFSRGEPVYLINLEVQQEDGEVVQSIVHRNYDEFKQLVDRVEEEGLEDEGVIVLPG